MIDLSVKLSELTNRDIGRWIVWTDPNSGRVEKGRLRNWGNCGLWVVFKCDDDWSRFQEYTPEACDPKECHFLAPYHPAQIQDLPRE